jgi:hypothetical protein
MCECLGDVSQVSCSLVYVRVREVRPKDTLTGGFQPERSSARSRFCRLSGARRLTGIPGYPFGSAIGEFIHFPALTC